MAAHVAWFKRWDKYSLIANKRDDMVMEALHVIACPHLTPKSLRIEENLKRWQVNIAFALGDEGSILEQNKLCTMNSHM